MNAFARARMGLSILKHGNDGLRLENVCFWEGNRRMAAVKLDPTRQGQDAGNEEPCKDGLLPLINPEG